MIFKGVTNISLLLPHEILFLLSHVQSFLLCFPLFLPSYSPLPLPNALGMPMATEVFKCAKTHTVEKMSAINGSLTKQKVPSLLTNYVVLAY